MVERLNAVEKQNKNNEDQLDAGFEGKVSSQLEIMIVRCSNRKYASGGDYRTRRCSMLPV